MVKYLSRLTFFTVLVLVSQVATAGTLRIPQQEVSFRLEWNEVSNSDVILSDVPSGYDVSNSTYLGWCIEMNDSFELGVELPGVLVAADSLPADLGLKEIIYILNHKQGGRADVQQAIWFFTDDNADLTATAQAMIQEAVTFAQNFEPGPGQLTAVVLLPTAGAVQNMVLEVVVPDSPGGPPPNECDDFVTGGGWIVGTPSGEKANFGVHGGLRNGQFWGGLNYIDHSTGMHVKSTAVTGYSHLSDVGRQINFNVTIDGVAGTAIVNVYDNGEPGRADVFEIQLSSGYNAGGDLAGPRPGGGNLQLHKSKCGQGNGQNKPSGKRK